MGRMMLTFSLVGLAAVAAVGGRSQDTGKGLAKPAAGARNNAQRPRMAEAYGKLPLSFEANEGQTDRRVKFISRGAGYALFVTPDEVVMALRKPEQNAKTSDPLRRVPQPEKAIHAVLRIKLAGGNSKARTTGVEELAGKSNYFIGSDRTKWRTNVPNYSKVKVQDVYPGIDLVYYGNQRQLEEDFVVAPGAVPTAIAMKISGAAKISIADGDLVLAADGGELRLRKPAIYQETAEGRREVGGAYALRGAQEVTFEVAEYDRTRPLIIDPVLAYSTYLGGSGFEDAGFGIAVDSSGNAYVTGETASTNFPGINMSSIQSQPKFGSGEYNAFVTEINAAGTAQVYSTYLGGSFYDSGNGIAVDFSGNAYVTGFTGSTDFPTTTNPIQSNLSGAENAFVTEINAGGTELVYSTYLGIFEDVGNGIAVDSSGNAYVTGSTETTNFPGTMSSLIQSAYGGGIFNAFVTKINAGGTLGYSTYLGGSNADAGFGIAVDSSGNAYVTGFTESTNFPGTPMSSIASGNSIQPNLSGAENAFVTKINAVGTALVYSTYLGGSSNDLGRGIAVDSSGNAYVTGFASSTNFPGTPMSSIASGNSIQPALGGPGAVNAFVTEINAGGTALVYSTYLGGSNLENGNGIAVDSSGNAYVTGETRSTDFPTMNAIQPNLEPVMPGSGLVLDTFVTEINAGGTALVYSTYLGGSFAPDSTGDAGYGIAVDSSGSAYVTGVTQSAAFPGASSSFIQPALSSEQDAFVTKIAPVAFATSSGQLSVRAVPLSSLPAPLPAGVTFPYGFFTWTVTGLTPGQTVTVTMTFPAPIPSNAEYFKVIGGTWTKATTLFTSNGNNVATLTITDGGFGDEDGVANGQITDPGGLGIPVEVAVPNVVGQTQAAATLTITSAGLMVGTVTTTSSTTVAPGNVISETPAALTMVNGGSTVALTVSSGPPQVAVPNVVGQTQAAATLTITSAGLMVGTVTTTSSTTVAPGNVISETPAALTMVNGGSTVALTVSSGPPQVAVPNVVGQTQAAATLTITSAGLMVGTVTTTSSTTVAPGNVISETPAALTMVNGGSAVNLVVSSGVAVPNVVGQTQAAATLTITSAGLMVGTVTTTSSTMVAPGNVISETPAALTMVNGGSAVNLVVSSSPPALTTPVITWPEPGPITYGTPLSQAQLDATANVAGSFVYSPAAGTILTAGVHTLSLTFNPTNTSAYTSATAMVTLQVNQATPRVLWVPVPIIYGTPLGPLQLDAFTLVPGTFAYTPPGGTVLHAGKQELSATFTPSDTTDFQSITVHATLLVIKATPHVDWPQPAPIAVGAPLSATQLDATANVPGTFTYNPTFGTQLGTGTRTLKTTFVPTDEGDYENVTAQVQIIVRSH